MGYRDEYLQFIDSIFQFFIDCWHTVCYPFLGKYYTSAAGQPPHLVPEHSYLLVIVSILSFFITCVLLKKIIFFFVEGV